MVHDRDSLGIVDRVHISDDTEIVRRRAQVTGVGRRRRWSDEEKGRIVAEAIAPDAVIAVEDLEQTVAKSRRSKRRRKAPMLRANGG
jgi:hypothetical protein